MSLKGGDRETRHGRERVTSLGAARMGCAVLQRDARNVTERVGMSANTPKGGREREGGENEKSEREAWQG